MRRLSRRVALSHLFLFAAVIVVAIAMVGLGNWIGVYLANSISRGVAKTAAASIEALVTDALGGLGSERPLTADDRARLDRVFRIGNDAASTRLLQIRIRDLNGDAIYESFGGIINNAATRDFESAASGEVVSRVGDLPLQGVGEMPTGTIPVLQIHTPLRGLDTDQPFAVAELYYSAQSILEIRTQAQSYVWALIGIAGLVVIAALYLLVARASRTIASQRANLARNLVASRRLSEENLALHAASERLRLEASLSNERLLAQVGSELHDGPVQLLALIILRLTKAAGNTRLSPEERISLERSVEHATEVMEELRNISSGLVLPELAGLTLRQSVALAIERHEGATGRPVIRRLRRSDAPASAVVKICAYRVVQEALNNAFWHGDESRPSVSLDVDSERCLLSIRNSSLRGTAHGNEERVSLGLRSMRFRVESLGGSLGVEWGAGGATTISATIPLSLEADQPISSILTVPVS